MDAEHYVPVGWEMRVSPSFFVRDCSAQISVATKTRRSIPGAYRDQSSDPVASVYSLRYDPLLRGSPDIFR